MAGVLSVAMASGCDRSSSSEKDQENEAVAVTPADKPTPPVISTGNSELGDPDTGSSSPPVSSDLPVQSTPPKVDQRTAPTRGRGLDRATDRREPVTERAPPKGPAPSSLDPGDSGLPTIDLVGLPTALRHEVAEAFEAAKTAPSDPNAIGELGMYYYAANTSLAAIPCFERALKLEPSSLRWSYYLGLAHAGVYDFDKAAQAYRRALEIDNAYAPVALELADILRRENVGEARTLYQKVLALSPKEARAHLGMGECEAATGNFTEALLHFEEAIRLAPKYAAANAAMADALEKLGRTDEARVHRDVQQTGGLPPLLNDPLLIDLISRSVGGQDLLVLAERLARAGEVNQAIEMLQQAIERNESELSARHALGVLLGIKGRFTEAVEEFRAVLRKNPHQFSTLVELARALSRLGSFSEAEALLREVLSISSSDSRAVMLYGTLLLQLGRAEDAVRYFQTIGQSRPDFADVHWQLAKAHIIEQKYDAAVQSYQRAVQLYGHQDEHHKRFIWELIRLMSDQRRAAASGMQVDQRLEIKSMQPLARAFESSQLKEEAEAANNFESLLVQATVRLLRRGAVLEAERIARVGLPDRPSDRESKVITFLRQELVESKDEPALRHLVAQLMASSGDSAGAQSLWRETTSRHPEFEPPYIAWAIQLLGENKPVAACELLRSGLAEKPDSPLINNALAWLLATTSDESIRNPAEAVQLAQKACERTGYRDAELLDTLAAAHASNGNFKEAARFQQEAINAASQTGQQTTLTRYHDRLSLYEKGIPYIEKKR